MVDQHAAAERRLLVVSNRLPFTVAEENGRPVFKPSAGGLVSGLIGYLESLGVEGRGSGVGNGSAGANADPRPPTPDPQADPPYTWIGWPGAPLPDEMEAAVRAEAYEHHNAYPVFLSESDVASFYNGFANDTLWPLFHYFPTYASFDEGRWHDYERVNRRFADAVLEVARPDDIIWVHDYHLMLVPGMIRERMPEATVGYFLHIPFPSYEVFRLLPRKWGATILEGLLGADLLGFHTHDYTRYFLRSVLRILGYENNMGQIAVQERIVQASTFPLGIDYEKYSSAVSLPEVHAVKADLDRAFDGVKMVLSIDRLDYTKGLINRLQGYQIFLKENPHWHRKVVLALMVVPSREHVEKYQQTREQIQELVGSINGEFGTLTWTPVVYLYRALPFASLIAMYTRSDVALITPLRDGMNLVAKEYIATRTDRSGVLILSEMAGAARELGEALLINPNSREEIAAALKEALEMPLSDQVSRNRAMQSRLRRYDVVAWGQEFMDALFATKEVQARYTAKVLTAEMRGRLLADYAAARRRILFFDYDGTLTPFVKDPKAAVPSPTVIAMLERLSEDPRNRVVIISGRDRETLEAWFGDLDVGLVGEHGVWTRPGRLARVAAGNGNGHGHEPLTRNRQPPTGWTMLRHLDNEWKPKIRPLLDMFVDRLPGSFIEEKDFSLAWHYRAADPELAPVRAKELMAYLVDFTGNIDVQVLQGNKVIEVKCAGVSKGTAGMYWLRPQEHEYDFIMAIGDDWTDEHLFMALPEQAYTIRVGVCQSYARFNLRTVGDVLQLIGELSSPQPAERG